MILPTNPRRLRTLCFPKIPKQAALTANSLKGLSNKELPHLPNLLLKLSSAAKTLATSPTGRAYLVPFTHYITHDPMPPTLSHPKFRADRFRNSSGRETNCDIYFGSDAWRASC